MNVFKFLINLGEDINYSKLEIRDICVIIQKECVSLRCIRYSKLELRDVCIFSKDV